MQFCYQNIFVVLEILIVKESKCLAHLCDAMRLFGGWVQPLDELKTDDSGIERLLLHEVELQCETRRSKQYHA